MLFQYLFQHSILCGVVYLQLLPVQAYVLQASNQFRPKRLGPDPFTTTNGTSADCASYFTCTLSVPSTTSCCPKYDRSRIDVDFNFGGCFQRLRYVFSLMSVMAAPVSTLICSGAPFINNSTTSSGQLFLSTWYRSFSSSD